MASIKSWLPIAIIPLCLFADPIEISFADLPREESDENFRQLQNQDVTLRGFLYKNAAGRLILAPQPNLKSCCIGSLDKKNEQIALVGDMLEEPEPSAFAVTLQGKLTIALDADAPYTLKNFSVQERNAFSLAEKGGTWALALCLLGIAWGVIYRLK